MTIIRQSPSGRDLELDSISSDEVFESSTDDSLTSILTNLYLRHIEYLDLDDDPVALWNFDDTLSAVRGPNINSTAGQYAFTDVYPGVRGVFINAAARLAAPIDSSLQLLGAMSVEILLALDSLPYAWICGVAGTGGTGLAVNNIAWAIDIPNRNTGLNWETGGGTPVSYATSLAAGGSELPPVHNIMSLGFSRSAAGVVQPYLNGRVLGPPSSPLTLPTSGINGQFTLGGRLGTGASFGFCVLSTAIYNRERPASEWLASYNRSLGQGLGILTSETP